MVTIKDIERFKEPFKLDLGKIDLYGCGRKENRVILEFNLYQGKGTHRKPGEEYLGSINLTVYNRLNTKFHMVVSPNHEHLPALTRCGLNPLYYDYLKAANNLLLQHRLKYMRLVPVYVVAGIIDNLLMVEKIANKQKQ